MGVAKLIEKANAEMDTNINKAVIERKKIIQTADAIRLELLSKQMTNSK